MENPSLEIREFNIVCIGSFNPLIFHPQWLARKEIIGDEAVNGATIKLSHMDISEFELDFCKFQIVPEKFIIQSSDEPYFDKCIELVIQIFRVLRETPIYQMGINLINHFQFQDEDSWHAFGDKIVPKVNFWNKILTSPRLSQLNIQANRIDDYSGYVMVTTGSSTRIKKYGVALTVNDHFELCVKENRNEADASNALEILEKKWGDSKTQATKITEEIIKYGITS